MIVNAINIYKNIGVNNTTGYSESGIIPKGDTRPNKDSTRGNAGVTDTGDTLNVSAEGSNLLNLGVRGTGNEAPYLQEDEGEGAAAAISYNARQAGITEDAVELRASRNETRVFTESLEAVREQRAEEAETRETVSSKEEKEDITAGVGSREEAGNIPAAAGNGAVNALRSTETEEAGNSVKVTANAEEQPAGIRENRVENRPGSENRAENEPYSVEARDRASDAGDKAVKAAGSGADSEDKGPEAFPQKPEKTYIRENNFSAAAARNPAGAVKEEEENIEIRADRNNITAENKEKEEKTEYALNKAEMEDKQQEKRLSDRRLDASYTDEAQEDRAEATEERIDLQKERNTLGNAGNIYAEDPGDRMYKVVFSFRHDPNEVASTPEEMGEEAFNERLESRSGEERQIENITVNITAPENNEETAAEAAEVAPTLNSETAAGTVSTENAEAATTQAALNILEQNTADSRLTVQEML